MSDAISKICCGISLIQNTRFEAYKNYLEEMTEDYLYSFIDYLLNSSEEDVVNSEYLMNADRIIGIGFYKAEEPSLTTVHKILYFEDPSYECMQRFFESITDGKDLPHRIVWKFDEDCLIPIGINLCFKHNGYMESFSNNSTVYFTVGDISFD